MKHEIDEQKRSLIMEWIVRQDRIDKIQRIWPELFEDKIDEHLQEEEDFIDRMLGNNMLD